MDAASAAPAVTFWFHHAGFDEVFVAVVRHVVTFVALALLDFFDDDEAFLAGVVSEFAGWELDRTS